MENDHAKQNGGGGDNDDDDDPNKLILLAHDCAKRFIDEWAVKVTDAAQRKRQRLDAAAAAKKESVVPPVNQEAHKLEMKALRLENARLKKHVKDVHAHYVRWTEQIFRAMESTERKYQKMQQKT